MNITATTITNPARRSLRTVALAGVTAALALGLTACGGGGANAAAGAAAGDTGPVARPAVDGIAATGVKAAHAVNTLPGSGATTTATAAEARQCRGDELLVTAVHRFAGEQGDHLLVTASNEGRTACWVTSYPAVKLGGDVDGPTLPHSKKDAPGGDKRITLRPGGKVYSAVNLFDYGTNHHTARSFALALRGTDGRTGPFYSVDTTGAKAAFSWNEADVLNWNTRKPYDF
ncbi:DUF4232 domain-containing protein [Streptomyces sp. NPDC048659]|uniref:DUF4232 domain-containing protein n=1 Tax=Streptomyces sp. NPDC048659 TaxID=3155489 RepID=UPI00343C8DFA